ncbi:MAG: hypothetical protein WEA31_08640 [Pirellulales bacterium]
MLVLLGCLFLAGCGDARRQSVVGTVTVNGEPVESGHIEFRPQPGTSGPTAGSPIHGGEYEITSGQGPFTGAFRVEIRAMRDSGRMIDDLATGERVPALEQFLPPEYNENSSLTAEVTAEQQRYDFDLTLPQ